jgi:hypothetical protein
MVEAGNPEWDLVDVGGRFIFDGEDLIEPLDMSLIPNAKTLDPGWVTPKGIFTSTGATVIAWNTAAFPADTRDISSENERKINGLGECGRDGDHQTEQCQAGENGSHSRLQARAPPR